MSRLIIGPDKYSIPFSGNIEHKVICFNKPVEVYIIECGKNEHGKSEYFVVLDRTFCKGSSNAPIFEGAFSTLPDLPNIYHDEHKWSDIKKIIVCKLRSIFGFKG